MTRVRGAYDDEFARNNTRRAGLGGTFGGGRAFTRSATAATTAKKRMSVEKRYTNDREPRGLVPPPPSLATLKDERRRESEKKTIAKRSVISRNRSRSPGLRTPSPGIGPTGNAFRRSVSHTSKVNLSSSTGRVPIGSKSAISSTRSNLASSTRVAASRFDHHHSTMSARGSARIARSPSPATNCAVIPSGRVLSRSSTSVVSSPPRSPTLRPNRYERNDERSQMLEGISRSLIENFGIEPDDLKINNNIVLGTGGFGTVYMGDYQATDVAVKVHHADRSWQADEIQEWKREVSIMTKLRHPNLLMLLGAVFYRQKLAIVTELCEKGTLFKLQQAAKATDTALTWGTKVEWLTQIAKGMAFLHHKRIFHRDLKSANVFVTGETMKIADFGLSRIRKDLLLGLRAESMGKESQRSSLLTKRRQQAIAKENSRIQGTFAFIAPEIWNEQTYSEKVCLIN